MSEENGTEVPVSTAVDAAVNVESDDDMITLYTRIGRHPVQVRRGDHRNVMAESDLVYTIYDVDECESNFLAAYRAVEEPVMMLVDARTKLGYIPEGVEAAANEAWGQAVNTYRTLTLALGANVPNEGEVRSWSEHRQAHGEITLDAFPKMIKAAENVAAVDAYEAQQGQTKKR